MNFATETIFILLTAYSLARNNVFVYVAYAIYSIAFLSFLMLSSRLQIGYTDLIAYLVSSKKRRLILQTALWFSIKLYNNNDQPISNLLCLLLMVVSLETCELTFYAFNASSKHICFMSKNKIGTSWCGLTLTDNLSICYREDLKHLVECHSDKFQPTSSIGYHQTSFSSAIKIASSGFKPGSKGMFGAGIYFARSFDHTNGKAHFTGPVIIAQAYLGRVKTLTRRDRTLTLKKLNDQGYDSVYADVGMDLSRPEFVIYEPDRVKQWIVCL